MLRTLEITSYVGCPNRCSYCPWELLNKTYKGNKRMTLDQFRMILNNTPKDVRIDFSGFSEIFWHVSGALFIAEAITQGYTTVLYTTLVGFKKEDIEVLKGLRFAEVVFHQFDGCNLDEFNHKVKIFEDNIQSGRRAIIEPQWKISRAGNVWDVDEQKGPFHCAFSEKKFHQNVVLPNGDVYLCCMDYGLKHRMGNLYETDYDNLNRTEIYDLSNREDSQAICRKCERFRHD